MRPLIYAARPEMILKYFGRLYFRLALLTLVLLTVSLFLGDCHISFRYSIVAVRIFVLSDCLLNLLAPKCLQNNEAMAIIASIFLFAPLVLSWTMMASGLEALQKDIVHEVIEKELREKLAGRRQTISGQRL